VLINTRNKAANALDPATMDCMKNFDELNFVKLESALLCVNCEMIVSKSRGGRCPVCGSGALLGMSRLLGGTLDFSCAEGVPAEAHGFTPHNENRGVSLPQPNFSL
jgi:hypothetical protein